MFHNALVGRKHDFNHAIPEVDYLRINQIIGNPKADPPLLPIIPVSLSSSWAGVKSGRFPKPIKLGPRTTAWRVSEIRTLIEGLGS